MLELRTWILRSVLFAIALQPALAAASEPYIQPEDMVLLDKDPKGSCVVAAQIIKPLFQSIGYVDIATPEGVYQTLGANDYFRGDGFALLSVPKGPFRIKSIEYRKATGRWTPTMKPIYDLTILGNSVGHTKAVGRDGGRIASDSPAKRGELPNELSGTCEGGFVWLGTWKLLLDGSPRLERIAEAPQAKDAFANLKQSLKGTAWEAEIDHPAAVKPLPADQKVGGPELGPKPRPTKPRIGFVLTVLDPGAEPRRELRYEPVAGDKRTVQLDLQFGPGKQSFVLPTTVSKGNTPEAPLRYEWTVGADVTGWVQHDEHGQHNDGDHKFAPGKEPKVGPPVSPAAQITNTVVPLPAEPIGVGASWVAELTAERNGNMKYQQWNTYKLVSFDGKVAKIAIEQAAQTTFAKPLQLPLGGKPVAMLGNLATGKGEATIELTRMLPLSYKLATTAKSLFAAPGGGEPVTNDAVPATTVILSLQTK